MNKLDELIQELCPDGVEYKSFGDCAKIVRGASPRPIKNFITTEPDGVNWIKIGDVKPGEKYITSSAEKITLDGAKKSRPVKKGDFILSNSMSFGRPYILKIDGCVHDGWLAISEFSDSYVSDFLYYLLSSNMCQNQMKKKASFGGAVQNLNADIVRELSLPVPPLEVQQEIVRLLDDFTAKTAELQDKLNEELEARKKQYEYYRNAILNGDKNAETVKLGDVCDFVRGPFGGALKKDSFVSSGYAVYEQQHAIYQNTNIRYFIDSKKYNDLIRFKVSPNDIIVSCSGTIGKTYIIPNDAPKGIINQALLKLTAHDCLNVRYLQYIFENNLVKIMNNNARGGAIKNVPSVKELKNIEIQLPSNDTQGRIINILDNLESTCDNLQTNISVEFESRQKQYEYYRDKLLTFKELNESEVN